MKGCGSHLHQSSDSSQALESSVFCSPFSQSSSENVVTRPLIICIHCGSYLCKYSLLSEDNLNWICPFCRMSNPQFYPISALSNSPHLSKVEQLRSMHQELQSDSFESHESKGGQRAFSPGITLHREASLLTVLAFDASLFTDPAFFQIPGLVLDNLNEDSLVSIVMYSSSVNILRLCSLKEGSPIAYDTISGRVDQSSALRNLVEQHVYASTVALARSDLPLILASFASLAKVPAPTFSAGSKLVLPVREGSGQPARRRPSSRSSSQLPTSQQQTPCTVECILGIAATLGQRREPGVRLMLFCDRPLAVLSRTLASGSDSSRGATVNGVEVYTNLAHKSIANNCWIDVFHVGAHTSSVDKLEALCNGTGGLLCTALTCSDMAWRRTLLAALMKVSGAVRPVVTSDSDSGLSISGGDFVSELFQYPNPSCDLSANGYFPQAGTVVSVEVRTSPNVVLNRLIGPVISADQAAAIMVLSEKSKETFSTKVKSEVVRRFCVDRDHLNHTVECLDSCAIHTTMSTVRISDAVDRLYDNLQTFGDENVVVGGIFRCDSSLELTLITETKNENDIELTKSRDSALALRWMSAPASPSSRDRTVAHQQLVGFGYIQCVCKYRTGDGLCKVTKVLTIKIPITQNIGTYFEGIESKLWALSIARSHVASYHDDVIAAFGGACHSNKSSSTGSQLPRDAAIGNVNSFVRKTFASLPWRESAIIRDKFERFCRSMYHLTEGPLLDGPAMQPQQSYLLRSRMLMLSRDTAFRYLEPDVRLVMLAVAPSRRESRADSPSSPASEHSYVPIMAWQHVNADSTSLVPTTVTLIDLGDCVVVRCGKVLAEGASSNVERMMLWAITQANGIAYSRYPAAHVHVIKNPTSSSLDRLVYARLSPSHTDERSSVLAANPLLNLLTPEALADFFAEAPPTDQLTFERYLHHEVPKFAKFRKEVDYRAGVAAPTGELMDRGKLEPKNAGIVTSKDGGEKSGLGRTLSGLMTALFGKGGVALGTTQESDSENI